MLEQCCQRFWHNYVAAKDALRVFLSMRIKRLLKFIDITDSIKLCLAPLSPLPHHTLCYCPRACIACLCFASCVFFLRFFAFQLPFQRIFYAVFCEWRGNGSKFSMSSMAATDDWQQNWQCQKQRWWRRRQLRRKQQQRQSLCSWARAREGKGRLVRGANSICVKNTFSCCACFKYNTQPAKKQQQQQRRRQRAVNCIIFKGTN